MTKQELEALSNKVVTKLLPKIEMLIDEKINKVGIQEEELLTQTQLAELLGVAPSYLHGKSDIYPHITIGKRKRFLKSSVLAMLQNQ